VSDNVKFALYLAVALVPSLVLHERAHAWWAGRLGDLTPKAFGRATLNPRAHVDPFGSIVLPLFLLVLWASGRLLPPVFAYAKAMPLNPQNMKDPARGPLQVALAGMAVNLALAVLAALAVRAFGLSEAGLVAVAFLHVNVVMFVFQLMPVPGLDGSVILSRFLRGRAREVYGNLDQYLPLFMLVIFFLLSAPLLTIVNALGNSLCGILVGFDCLS